MLSKQDSTIIPTDTLSNEVEADVAKFLSSSQDKPRSSTRNIIRIPRRKRERVETENVLFNVMDEEDLILIPSSTNKTGYKFC